VQRDYELGFILSPEVSEEQTNTLLQRIEQIVTNHGGQIVKVNQWGRRRLAYPIKHHRDGLYVFIDMILTPETPLELDRTLNVTEEVLRHLIKQRDAKTVQKEREEREARAAAAASQAQASVAQTPAPTTPTEPAAEVATEVEPELPIGDEVEAPIEISEEDLSDVPPAIEETV
jgi:small subunit ribosomal protein S6